MMNINSMDGMNQTAQMGQKSFMAKGMDSVSKSIQNQIGNAQKQLQELSANKEMSMEEKMKKRQEIQEQITDLNKQLRQHQIEQRKEMQEVKQPSKNDISNNEKADMSKAGNKRAGLSQASMTAMISADSAIGQADHLKTVATKMEGQKNILATEIKLDAQRGRDVEAKQGEMGDLEERIMKVKASQINALDTAKEEMEEASKTDQKTEKAENNKDKKIEKEEQKEKQKEENAIAEKIAAEEESQENNLPAGIYYTKIDICL